MFMITSKTKLLLVRHGETEWNLLAKIQGCTDIELTDNGRLQAEEVSARLSNIENAVYYSSPLVRARYTAEAIAKGKEVHIMKELEEVHFGSWEGYRFDQVVNHENYHKFVTGEDGGPFGDSGNTIRDYSKKNGELLMKLAQENEGKTIIVVSHGAWIKCAILGLLHLEPVFYHRFVLGNTGITSFVFRDGMAIMQGFNDHSHLSLGNRSNTG